MVAKTQEFHKRSQKVGSLMKAKWYLIGAIALGVIVFLYLFLWGAVPCHEKTFGSGIYPHRCHSRFLSAGIYRGLFQMDTCHNRAGLKSAR